jgi:hypothetical protein
MCRYLRAELDRRENEYAGLRGRLITSREGDDPGAYQKIRIECVNARLDVAVAQLEIEQHKRIHEYRTRNR